MAADDRIEQAFEALLDGRSLPSLGTEDDSPHVRDPLRLLEAVGRAHRIAMFGGDLPLEQPARTRWGHLEIRVEIGRGATGAVYRAWDSRLTREVALKLFAEDVHQDSALEEGRLLSRLNHPHIVRVFGADIHDGVAGIWMELLEGHTLDALLERDGVFGPEEVLALGTDLARALAAVHAAGLLHRDVKARNVIRERGGRVVLMDLSAGRSSNQIHASGDEAGTPMYMAPEVLEGAGASERTDVYSLGVLLFRLLSGTFPVAASTLADLRAAHAQSRRASLRTLRPDVAPSIADVVERGCAPDPDTRFAAAAAFEAAISETLGEMVAQKSARVAPLPRLWKHWRVRVLTASVGTALVALVVVAGWNMPAGRAARRAAGFPVPPRSALYVTMMGAIGIVQDGRLTLIPGNPHWAPVIAVSSDRGIVTRAGSTFWRYGARFQLEGTPAALPAAAEGELCCFQDGTTDGRHNYSPRNDFALFEPGGSRTLTTPAVYRFDRDWMNPEKYFDLPAEGAYPGITYAADTDTFWLVKVVPDGSAIEQWSRDGRRLSVPVRDRPGSDFRGIGLDPRDGTLWVVQDLGASDVVRFQNFDRTGRHLGSFAVPRLSRDIVATTDGAEFAWTGLK